MAGEGDEADTVSLVRHLTEGNGPHEYFMGSGCLLPHIHNLFVLLQVVRSVSQQWKKKGDIENVQKERV